VARVLSRGDCRARVVSLSIHQSPGDEEAAPDD
jgi:hypothetical protein